MKLFLDTIFPRSCLLTGKACSDKHFDWITSGIEDLQLIRSSRCSKCGSSLGGYLKDNYGCTLCQEFDPVFSEARAIARYEGPVGRLLRELKYKRGYYICSDLIRILKIMSELETWLGNAQLVPVPLHKKQFRNRGFNQSEVLAKLIEEVFPETNYLNLIERIKQTKTQTKLDRLERAKNVRTAFRLIKNKSVHRDKNYVIIDDIITTGATLNACAEVLIDAGAKQVKVLTFAHG